MTAPEQLAKSHILVDTDVFSYMFRGDSRASCFRSYVLNRTPAISFKSVAELYYGAYRDSWGLARSVQLLDRLKSYVVIPYDYLACQLWGQIRPQRRADGHEIGHANAWIAATALRHNCALATNDTRDFVGIEGLVVIAPGLP